MEHRAPKQTRIRPSLPLLPHERTPPRPSPHYWDHLDMEYHQPAFPAQTIRSHTSPLYLQSFRSNPLTPESLSFSYDGSVYPNMASLSLDIPRSSDLSCSSHQANSTVCSSRSDVTLENVDYCGKVLKQTKSKPMRMKTRFKMALFLLQQQHSLMVRSRGLTWLQKVALYRPSSGDDASITTDSEGGGIVQQALYLLAQMTYTGLVHIQAPYEEAPKRKLFSSLKRVAHGELQDLSDCSTAFWLLQPNAPVALDLLSQCGRYQDPIANFRAGRMLAVGDGCSPNGVKAIRLLKIAATMGSTDAQVCHSHRLLSRLSKVLV